MLKPLHTERIDRALELLGIDYTTKDVRGITFEHDRVWLSLVPGWYNDADVLRKIEDHERDTYTKALRNLYGGDLNKVLRVEIFSDGYLVQVRTNVFDHAENEFVFEQHVGHLVVDE